MRQKRLAGVATLISVRRQPQDMLKEHAAVKSPGCYISAERAVKP